jgi:hypothetical protein
MGNIYLTLSLLTIIFLFTLQLINRRFLLLSPVFQWLSRDTKTIDTYLLYLFLLCSIIFSTCGILYDQTYLLKQLERTATCKLMPAILIIGFGTVLFFLFERKKLIRYLLVKKLKKNLNNEPYEMEIEHSCVKCKSNTATLKRYINAWNSGTEQLICKNCNHTHISNKSLRLGDVDIKDKILNIRLIKR